MTDPQIHNLGITDTDYAALAAKGYDPHLEQLMIEVDIPPDEARSLTRLVGLTKDKPPKTDEEWDELMNVLEDITATVQTSADECP